MGRPMHPASLYKPVKRTGSKQENTAPGYLGRYSESSEQSAKYIAQDNWACPLDLRKHTQCLCHNQLETQRCVVFFRQEKHG